MATPFNTSRWGKLLNLAAHSRKPTIGLLGESHGTTYLAGAIAYACYAHYNADVTMDFRTYAAGGQMFAVGGTTTTDLLNTQVPQFLLRPADIAFIANGYNDQPMTSAAAITTVNNILSAADSCLEAGAQAVVLMGQTPRNLTNSIKTWMQMNDMLRNACNNNDRLYFVDVTSAIADLTATTMIYRGPAFTVLGSYSIDGTHWGSRAVRAIAPLIADVLQHICPLRTPRLSHCSGAYDPVNFPYANFTGDGGNMLGTSGLLNSSPNAGVAGTGAASRLSITTSGGLTVTPSIFTAADGRRKQQLDIGGTISGSNLLSVTLLPTIATPNNSDAARMLTAEIVVELENVSGIVDLWLRPVSSTYDTPKFHGGGSGVGGTWEDNVTQKLFMYSTFPVPVPSAANPAFTLLATFRNDAGATPTGTIKLSQFGAHLTAAT